MHRRRIGGMLAAAVAALLAVSLGVPGHAVSTSPAAAATRPERSDSAVAEELQKVMDGLQFQQVLDLMPFGSAPTSAVTSGVDKDATTPAQRASRYAASATPQPIFQQPQIDATVLELDKHGRILSSGTVLMSPQYRHGIVVPVDQNFHTSDVRWRQWDDDGWYINRGQGTIDVVPGRDRAPIDYMLPYPASVLKLMVSFGILRLVDKGEIKLSDTYNYQPTASSALCGPASSDTIQKYIDASLTWSSNPASCALIKLLWDHKAIDSLNQTFGNLGLETLQLQGTNPATGGRWTNSITMSSLDTAKLLALINGAPGTIWTTPGGTAVTGAVLSESSRRLFKWELSQQGWNWMLSTTNYCGAGYPAPGLPQYTAQRWIAADGTVTVNGNYFGQDVRPCNRAAEVTFAHKPGWVSNTGADAGIVHSLPGKEDRHYIISVFSNLGDQYQDPNRPPTPPGVIPPEYTEKLAQLGRALDRFEADR